MSLDFGKCRFGSGVGSRLSQIFSLSLENRLGLSNTGDRLALAEKKLLHFIGYVLSIHTVCCFESAPVSQSSKLRFKHRCRSPEPAMHSFRELQQELGNVCEELLGGWPCFGT